jgi:hypothetical protein
MPPTPKKGSIKKKPTYTKKAEVASSTAVNDKMKDIIQDPKSDVQFSTTKDKAIKTTIKDPKTKQIVYKRIDKKPSSVVSDGYRRTIKKEKGSKLSSETWDSGKRLNGSAVAKGVGIKYITDTTGYAKGKKTFDSKRHLGTRGNIDESWSSKEKISRDHVKNLYDLKKTGGIVKSKKK